MSVISCYPFLAYLWRQSPADALGIQLSARDFSSYLQGAFLLILGVSFFSALAGRFFSRRYGLGGVGSWDLLRKDLPGLAGLALVLIPVFLFALDPIIFQGRELLYPGELGAAAGITLKSSVFEEVVLRYGVVTILAGLTRSVWPAVILGAAFATVLGLRSGFIVGMDLEVSTPFLLMILVSLALNLFYGVLYARRGLVSSMTAHFLIDLKYPVAALLW